MKWPVRTIQEVAVRASGTVKVTPHRVLLALGFRYRAEKGLTLSEAVEDMGFTRRYGRAVCQQFGIEFPDYDPKNPFPLSLN